MKKKSKRNLFLILFSSIVLAGIAFYFYNQPEPAPSYATEPVRRGNIENSVLANGMLHPSKLVSVGAQVSGQINTLAVQLGQEVKQGDLIAQIDSLAQQNSLKEAQASLNSINAQYKAKQAQIHQATLEFERQKRMLADRASSRGDYEAAEADLAIYKAELDQLKAEKQQAMISVDDAKLDLSYTTINAPMDGTVVYASVSEGQTVNANQSTPTIIELAKLDTMTVKAQISEADVIHVHPGQQTYFTILGSSHHRYKGVLRAIEPGPTLMDGDDSDLSADDSDAIYYNGLFEVANPDHLLRIGMTAEVSIILDGADNALLVPSQILMKKPGPGNHYQVPVLINEQVEYRDVEVGINNKVNAQILSGLNEGDQIVIGMPAEGSTNIRRHGPPPMGM